VIAICESLNAGRVNARLRANDQVPAGWFG